MSNDKQNPKEKGDDPKMPKGYIDLNDIRGNEMPPKITPKSK